MVIVSSAAKASIAGDSGGGAQPDAVGQHHGHGPGGGQIGAELAGPLPGGPAAARRVGGAEALIQLGQCARAGAVGSDLHPAIQHLHQPGLRGRPRAGQVSSRPPAPPAGDQITGERHGQGEAGRHRERRPDEREHRQAGYPDDRATTAGTATARTTRSRESMSA
jgi:hypothetical protein